MQIIPPADSIPDYVFKKSLHHDKFDWAREQKLSEAQRLELIELISKNKYNAYCVDCQK